MKIASLAMLNETSSVIFKHRDMVHSKWQLFWHRCSLWFSLLYPPPCIHEQQSLGLWLRCRQTGLETPYCSWQILFVSLTNKPAYRYIPVSLSTLVGHNYRADILDCNFHINVLYAKPTISPPKMNSGFPMEKLSVVGGGVGQLHH